MAAALRSIRPGRASELGRPDHERFLEEPAGLEIAQQSGDRLIDIPGERLVRAHVAVRVPVVARTDIDQLDEAHAAFDHASRHEALPSEAGGLSALQSVKLQRGLGFTAQVEHVRHRRLHAEGGFE